MWGRSGLCTGGFYLVNVLRQNQYNSPSGPHAASRNLKSFVCGSSGMWEWRRLELVMSGKHGVRRFECPGVVMLGCVGVVMCGSQGVWFR